MAGLVLSYLLAFSLAMADLSRRRSLALARTQRHLRAQQRVQTLIARDQPLEETLGVICRIIEAQVPGGIASIMLCDEARLYLDRIYSLSLPQAYCDAIIGTAMGPKNGACGRAAISATSSSVPISRATHIGEDFMRSPPSTVSRRAGRIR